MCQERTPEPQLILVIIYFKEKSKFFETINEALSQTVKDTGITA
jgi:hypothetical protein